MNTPKTTAIDWLLTELNLRLCKIKSEPDGLVRETMINLLLIDTEQAREMEREQIIESYYAGTAQFANEAPIVNPKTPQDYYNETYGKSE